MDEIIILIAGIVAGITGFILFRTNDKGTGATGIRSDIQRAGDNTDRITERLNDNSSRIDIAADAVDRIAEEQRNSDAAVGKIAGLVKRGRKAIDAIRKADSEGKDGGSD